MPALNLNWFLADLRRGSNSLNSDSGEQEKTKKMRIKGTEDKGSFKTRCSKGTNALFIITKTFQNVKKKVPMKIKFKNI